MSRSVQRWMSLVRNSEIRNMVLLSMLACFFVLDFFKNFDVCMIGKNYCIVYLYTKTSQIDCFRLVHKILRWIGSSDFKLHILNTLLKSSSLALTYLTQEKKLCVFNYTVMTKFCMQNIKSSIFHEKNIQEGYFCLFY